MVNYDDETRVRCMLYTREEAFQLLSTIRPRVARFEFQHQSRTFGIIRRISMVSLTIISAVNDDGI